MKATITLVVETDQIDAVNVLEIAIEALADVRMKIESAVVMHQSDTMVTHAIL